jgi:transposase
MNEIKLLAIDLAKQVFQLHGVDGAGKSVLRRQVKRSELARVLRQLPRCTVAMEACGSSHYWGRQCEELGHEAKLIAPQFVKPFVKGNKNDRNDASAIAEAAQRPDMRFVALKSVEQQQVLALHRIRAGAVKARTALSNQLRGLLSEFGVVAPLGRAALRALLAAHVGNEESAVPALLRTELAQQQARLAELDREVERLTKLIEQLAKDNERTQRLMARRGVGPMIASAFAAEVGDPKVFRNGRQVAAWLGLVPRHDGTGGKARLLGISKRGDTYLRTMLIHGARAVVRTAARYDDALSRWVHELAQRRGIHKATVAVANKMARQMWAELAYA